MLESFLTSILITGFVLEVVGFAGFFKPFIALIIIWPLYNLWKILNHHCQNFSHTNLLLKVSLVIIWLSHFVQVFVPETGFDALWYHLPIASQIAGTQKITYTPDLYQSLNPLFSDLFFTAGWLFLSDLGAKLIAYFFGLATILITFKISRMVLDERWSLLASLVVSTFQVVAWQSSSFYIDLAKAFFELSAIYLLYQFIFEDKIESSQKLIKSALFFSASMASKLFSIFLLPIFLMLIFFFSPKNKLKNTILYLLGALTFALPFYVFAHLNTGQAFYSFTVHLNKLGEIGGNSDPLLYLAQRSILLPLSPITLSLARDYTTVLFIIFLPIAMLSIYKAKLNPKIAFMFIFAISQYFLWWYLPPLSTRYALSGFILLAVLLFYSLVKFTKRHPNYLKPILLTIYLGILIHFAPRLYVNQRSYQYLSGKQTKAEYLNQFMDGNIDTNIKEWHFRATP